MAKDLSDKLQRELRELKLIVDEDIDLSDIPEVTDWSAGLRGLWTSKHYDKLKYDVRAVANEILRRAWNIGARPTNMWLNKATWFVYEHMLVKFGKLLTDARVEAWDHGPVFREIYGPSKVYKEEPVGTLLEAFSMKSKSMEIAEETFDTQTSSVIDEVVAKFADKSASHLREISHIEGSAWYRVWFSGQKTSAGMVISPNVILAAADNRTDQDE